MAGLAGGAVLPPLLVQTLAPPVLRGRVVALYLLINNLLSLGLGPLAVALLADRGSARGLSGALALSASLCLGGALCCYGVALMAFRRWGKRPNGQADACVVAEEG